MTDENGLVYMRARYYSPTFKRFINADVVAGSITNSITLNRYAYANGNPVSNADPFGLSAEEARGNNGSNWFDDLSSWWDKISKNIGRWANNTWSDFKKWFNSSKYDFIEWANNMNKHYDNAVKEIDNFLSSATYSMYYALTYWHFEGRAALNGEHPSYEEVTQSGSGWILLPEDMSIYHDNGVGAAELKYILPGFVCSKEAVFDGDNHSIVYDPNYIATYNYVNPMQLGDVDSQEDAAFYVISSIGHFIFDMVPYYLTGNSNTRDQFESKVSNTVNTFYENMNNISEEYFSWLPDGFVFAF